MGEGVGQFTPRLVGPSLCDSNTGHGQHRREPGTDPATRTPTRPQRPVAPSERRYANLAPFTRGKYEHRAACFLALPVAGIAAIRTPKSHLTAEKW